MCVKSTAAVDFPQQVVAGYAVFEAQHFYEAPQVFFPV
jgi:hypothetical protein